MHNRVVYYQDKARHWARIAMYARDVLGQKSTWHDAQTAATDYAMFARQLQGIEAQEHVSTSSSPFKFQNKTWCGAAIGWREI